MIFLPPDIKSALAHLSQTEKEKFCFDAIREKIIAQPQQKTSAINSESLQIFTDGGARGNPGPAGAGWILKQKGEIIKRGKKFLGEATNNQAEYQALILALHDAKKLDPQALEIHMDSELAVKQILGEYKVKNEELKTLFAQVKAVLQAFPKWSICHVRREQNKEADKLANEAMDEKS